MSDSLGLIVFCVVTYAIGSFVWSAIGWVLGLGVMAVRAGLRRRMRRAQVGESHIVRGEN